MKLKSIYDNLKNYFLNSSGQKELTLEQRDYVMSGFSKDLLKNYRIIYSPRCIQMTLNRNGTDFKYFKKRLEDKLEDVEFDLQFLSKDFKLKSRNYYINLKKKLKQIHKRNFERIQLNHLKKINKIYSSLLGKTLKNLKVEKVLIENLSNGGISLSFKKF